jgi:carbonic anhydrase/acetyltransferase-like protein (isoleucine patch superfamily)
MKDSVVALGRRTVTRARALRTPGLQLGAGTHISPKAQIVAPRGHVVSLGDGTVVHRGCILMPYGGNITLGRDCRIMPYVVLYGHGGLTIGDRVLIAAHTVIVAANHRISGRAPIMGRGDVAIGIAIGSDCWIAAHAVILDGVSIGEGAVVAAGAVVTKDVAPFTIVAGNPATAVKHRDDVME